MSAFVLETEAYEAGFDLNGLRDGWIELSKEKSWPLTEEGWRRYLRRTLDSNSGPRRPKEKAKAVPFAVPADFVAWWRRHEDCKDIDGQLSPSAKSAFRCARYYDAWREAVRARKEAA